jgi:hypothetical protein
LFVKFFAESFDFYQLFVSFFSLSYYFLVFVAQTSPTEMATGTLSSGAADAPLTTNDGGG